MNDQPVLSDKQRHSKHQAMLTEHRVQKEASRERAKYASPKSHKEDSEMFGFKTIVVAKR